MFGPIFQSLLIFIDCYYQSIDYDLDFEMSYCVHKLVFS